MFSEQWAARAIGVGVIRADFDENRTNVDSEGPGDLDRVSTMILVAQFKSFIVKG